MILPTKHVTLSNSLLSVSATLLNYLEDKDTISLFWDRVKSRTDIKTFDRFILGLDFLFMLGTIEFKDGLLIKVKK